MSKVGERYVFRDQEFWASSGLIYQMDYRDNIPDDERFTVATRPEFAARAIAINDENRRTDFKYSDERVQMHDLILDMCSCVKDAKRQGDPFDPDAARYMAMQSKKMIFLLNYNPSRHRSSLVGAGPSFESKVPPMPTAPADAPVAKADSAPDSSVN